MRYRRILLLGFVFLTFCFRGVSQEALQADEATLNQHRLNRVPPVYPPIAKAAHVQGTVVVAISVGTSGKIESMKVVSGPAMLQQAAIDCVKQWVFRPFEKNGSPVAASGAVSVIFLLGPPNPTDEAIATRYFPASDECRKKFSSKTDYEAAAAVCKQAAEIAEEFAPDLRFIEKRSAFVWASWALIYSGDLKTAEHYAERAVEVVKLGHDDNSGSNSVYCVRGLVKAKLGDLQAADRDLAVAEDFQHKGVAWAEKEAPGLVTYYRSELIQDLRIHAQVLQGLKRPDDAQKKLDEAAKYQ
jgi:TonB family protein